MGDEPESWEIRREQIRRRVGAIRARVEELRARRQDNADRATASDSMAHSRLAFAAALTGTTGGVGPVAP